MPMERLSFHRPSTLLTMVSKEWQYTCRIMKIYFLDYFSGYISCAHVIPPPKGEVPHYANHTFCSMKFFGGLEFSTGGKSLSMSTVKISPSALLLLFSSLTPAL